jgi:hypothetical protein
MSKIFVMTIAGSGIFSGPESDFVLGQCTTRMDSLLSINPAVAGLLYDTVEAFVIDGASPAGGEGTRTLNAIIDGFTYDGSTLPTEAAIDEMCTAIKVALKTDPGGESVGLITDVGEIRVNTWAEDPE